MVAKARPSTVFTSEKKQPPLTGSASDGCVFYNNNTDRVNQLQLHSGVIIILLFLDAFSGMLLYCSAFSFLVNPLHLPKSQLQQTHD